MALFIGGEMARGSILDISESKAAFHPWWDELQVFKNIFIWYGKI